VLFRGCGTPFTVLLPLTAEHSTAEHSTSRLVISARDTLTGHGTPALSSRGPRSSEVPTPSFWLRPGETGGVAAARGGRDTPVREVGAEQGQDSKQHDKSRETPNEHRRQLRSLFTQQVAGRPQTGSDTWFLQCQAFHYDDDVTFCSVTSNGPAG
jgi:hypothetical protein